MVAAESFFRRWARLKNGDNANATVKKEAPEDSRAATLSNTNSVRDVTVKQLPTLDDVSKLTASSDYSMFVAKGVDKTVQRLAMKKLFSDPHFNTMDRLDIYIDDYNQASPLSKAALASLKHVQNFLDSSGTGKTEADSERAAGENEHQAQLDASCDMGHGHLNALSDTAETSGDQSDAQRTTDLAPGQEERKTV